MAELTEKYGADRISAEMIEGSGGVFEVVIDGDRLYSKKETGRFPAYGEICKIIDEKLVRS